MASTNKTSLGLNQWVAADKPVREDFVNDNVIIDKNLSKLISDFANGIIQIGGKRFKVVTTLFLVPKQDTESKTFDIGDVIPSNAHMAYCWQHNATNNGIIATYMGPDVRWKISIETASKGHFAARAIYLVAV